MSDSKYGGVKMPPVNAIRESRLQSEPLGSGRVDLKHKYPGGGWAPPNSSLGGEDVDGSLGVSLGGAHIMEAFQSS